MESRNRQSATAGACAFECRIAQKSEGEENEDEDEEGETSTRLAAKPKAAIGCNPHVLSHNVAA